MEAVQLSWCKAAGTNLKVGGSNPPTATKNNSKASES